MRPPPVPVYEEARLNALSEYAPAAPFDDAPYAAVLELARDLFEVPTAFVSLLERDRQVFAVRRGLDLCETSREISFCAHAVAREDMLVVLDATLDPRFCNNPLVTGAPYIRFYAGAPLVSPSGHVIGTMCLADTRPRTRFDEEQRRQLRQLAVLVLDPLEMRRLKRAQDVGQAHFASIAAASPDGIICAGEDGRIAFWNAAAERMLGYPAAEALGRPLDLVMPERMRGSPDGRPGFAAITVPPGLTERTVALHVRRKDGTELPVEASLSVWRDEGATSFGAILRDSGEHAAIEEQLLRLAHQDPLTGLPNRTVLRHHVERLQGVGPAALLLLDLDDFRAVNDDFGRAVGDAVLQHVAERLIHQIGPDGTVARLDGDEFAVLMPGVTSDDQAAETAKMLVSALSQSVKVEGRYVSVGVSVGIALHPGNGTDTANLMESADLALHRAKAKGRRCVQKFTPALRRAADRARLYDTELHNALKRGEFEVFYQPQVRVTDGTLAGAEALLRWRHPRDGLLAPGAFMAALDRSPVSADVGRWVLHTACAQAAAWRAQGAKGFRIGVNLFGSQFRIGDLVADVNAALAATGLLAEALELEITENTILRLDKTMLDPLRALRGAEVGIAFDDYGTGYGSLSMLRRFPITRLKIDRGFVNGMCTNPADAAIVRSVLFLARSLDIAVTAEGVETNEQFEQLCGDGCEEVQGYLFGRPMPALKFAGLVSASPKRAA